ncbi:MAG: DsbA family protein [Pseudomonadota bacterium]
METAGSVGARLGRALTPVTSRALAVVVGERALAARRAGYRWRRQLRGEPLTVQAFLAVDDPYSLLMGRRLHLLQQAYRIRLIVHLVSTAGGPDARAATRAADHACRDAALLGRVLGEAFGATPARRFRQGVETRIATLLAADRDGNWPAAVAALEAYWQGDEGAIGQQVASLSARDLEAGRQFVQRGDRLLQRLGHYQPGMLYCEGEWYWGVDRLYHLTRRLDAEDTAGGAATARRALAQDIERLGPPGPGRVAMQRGAILDFFFSFRSPYSYLAIGRVYALARRTGMTVRLRPVLPMVLRGLRVPRAKRLYIINDAAREARRLRLPFGRIADPLAAAESLLAVAMAAIERGSERRFIEAAARAAWAEGRDLGARRWLNAAAAEAGLDPAAVSAALAARDAALERAGRNRDDLCAEGLWGVPSLRTGELAVWGQDRLGLLERLITREDTASS